MNVRLAAVTIAVALVGQGCLSKGPTSVGLYRAVPGPQKVEGSNEQVINTRTVNYNQTDTAEAITKAFNMMGLDFEARDDKTGLYTGHGNWDAPGQMTPCRTPYTFSAYIQQIDDKPTSTITVLIDRHTWCGAAANPEQELMTQIMGNFAKVLMTY